MFYSLAVCCTYEDEKAFLACKLLLERGVYVNPVISPATPVGKALIRTSYCATHKEAEIDEAMFDELDKDKIIKLCDLYSSKTLKILKKYLEAKYD